MTEGLQLDVARTAVLSMDLQAALVGIYAKDDPELTVRAARILQRARAVKMPVIHVQVGFRPGMPEVSARNPLFGRVKQSPEWQQMFQGPGGAIAAELGPEAGDLVVTKHRISAFPGTDLAMILQAQEVETLVLFGIATSGVVLATLLDATDADYRLVVVRDCCTDNDAEVHRVLTEKYFPRFGSVVTAEELLAALG